MDAGSGARLASYSVGKQGRFPLGIKQPRLETARSPSCSAGLRNDWSYMSYSPDTFMACTRI